MINPTIINYNITQPLERDIFKVGTKIVKHPRGSVLTQEEFNALPDVHKAVPAKITPAEAVEYFSKEGKKEESKTEKETSSKTNKK